MKLPLYTQAARDSSNIAASAEELINLYAEQAPGDAVTKANLRVVLGESLLASVPAVLPYATATVNGTIYASFNGDLWSIDPANGNSANLGTMVADQKTSIAPNGTYVTIAAGGTYYVWDGATLTTPGSGLLTSIGAVEYIDGYTIMTEKDASRFEWTKIDDPTDRNALNFATAKSRSDDILRPIAFGEVLYLFGTKSIEAWRNTGVAGSGAFKQLAGGVVDDGLKAYKLVAKFDDGIFFIGDDNTAKIMAGNRPATVSTPPVNVDLDEATPTHCSVYEDRGHTICCIRFSDRPAWCYDTLTQLWHRRASGVGNAWETQEIIKAGSYYHALDSSGTVARMNRVSTDVGTALRRVCASKPLYMDGKKFSVRKLQFLCRVGAADLGRDAKVVLQVSGDGGVTWSDEIEGSLGGQGEYGAQAEFYALGRFEQFNARFTMADAADITVYSDAVIEIG